MKFHSAPCQIPVNKNTIPNFKKVTNQYDEKDNLVSEKEVYYDNFGNSVTRYEYDSSSRLIKKAYYDLKNDVETLKEYVTYSY